MNAMRYIARTLPLLLALGVQAAQPLDIVKQTGLKGGLVVHLGCGNGDMTAAFRVADNVRVQGLDRSGARVAEARKMLLEKGLNGTVTVDTFDGSRLPYVDNLVNLLVADELGSVPRQEVIRVLAPNGVALIGGEKVVKPWPGEIDEWTHWLHDAGGNAVGADTMVGPPRHFQWTASPRWSSHHDTVLSTSALVTSGGRIFAIVNNAPISEFHDAS